MDKNKLRELIIKHHDDEELVSVLWEIYDDIVRNKNILSYPIHSKGLQPPFDVTVTNLLNEVKDEYLRR